MAPKSALGAHIFGQKATKGPVHRTPVDDLDPPLSTTPPQKTLGSPFYRFLAVLGTEKRKKKQPILFKEPSEAEMRKPRFLITLPWFLKVLRSQNRSKITNKSKKNTQKKTTRRFAAIFQRMACIFYSKSTLKITLVSTVKTGRLIPIRNWSWLLLKGLRLTSTSLELPNV